MAPKKSAWKVEQGVGFSKNYTTPPPKLKEMFEAATSLKGGSYKKSKPAKYAYEQNPWKLGKLNLKQQAADYYLLAWVQAEKELFGDVGPDELWPPYAKKLDYLVGQFSRYTDMAVGGELRHSRKMAAWNQIPKPIQVALTDGSLPSSRHSAWNGWYHVRQSYGTIALRWAMMSFQAFSGHSFGGLKWSVIAETLWKHESGVYSDQTFVDTCWGLEHNGGCYFNKQWQPGYLKQALDYNQNGNYAGLVQFSSKTTQKHLDKEGKLSELLSG